MQNILIFSENKPPLDIFSTIFLKPLHHLVSLKLIIAVHYKDYLKTNKNTFSQSDSINTNYFSKSPMFSTKPYNVA